MDCPPVLLLVFNRPDLTRQSFAAIRTARPSQLFVAADGPRPDKQDEAELCQETRRIATAVDWPCELNTLFREENLGCATACSEGITWFFEQVEEGMILEDDCVAHPSFFTFCRELLTRYRDNEQIMQISGFSPHKIKVPQSYIFSYSGGIWGWATWRRAWEHFDLHLSSLPQTIENNALKHAFHSETALRFWTDHFENFARRPTGTTWDLPWLYARLVNHGLSIIPRSNLITNVGIGQDSTHTKSDLTYKAKAVTPIQFPLIHPNSISNNIKYEKLAFATIHQLEMPDMNLFQYLAYGLRNRVSSLLRRHSE